MRKVKAAINREKTCFLVVIRIRLNLLKRVIKQSKPKFKDKIEEHISNFLTRGASEKGWNLLLDMKLEILVFMGLVMM